jgi:hypothetical protein
MRRLVAAASLAALGLSLAAPMASAHTDNMHRLAWGASPNPTTANDGGQVYSNDEIVAAAAQFDDGIKSWDVVIRPVNGGPPSTCHEDLAQQNGRYPITKVYINCPWDTTRATNHTLPGSTAGSDAERPEFSRTWQSQDLGPSANGKYTVEITVYNGGQPYGCNILGCVQPVPVEPHPLYQSGSTPPRWREVWVVNGISNPTGVNNSFDPASNKIAVSWAPNPEPDVSYLVQEKVGDGKWNAGATVPGSATGYDRIIDQPGKYQYQVTAVRPAPTANDGKGASATKKSDAVATQAVEIAQVTPPTTAGVNGADGSIDHSGDGGVFLPTDPTSPNAPGSHVAKPPKGSSAAGRSTGGIIGSRPSGSSSRPTGTTGLAGEGEGEEPDGGFSTALPYLDKNQDGELAGDGLGDGEEEPQSLTSGVTVPRPRDTRALLIPMAGSLTLFVFAMQVTVLMRRRPATVSGQDDFDDWMSY